MIARIAGRAGYGAARRLAGGLHGGEYRSALVLSLLVHAAVLLGLSLGDGRGPAGSEREGARTVLMRVHFLPEETAAAPPAPPPPAAPAARPASARTARTANGVREPTEVPASILVTVPVESPVDGAGSRGTSERLEQALPTETAESMPPVAEPAPEHAEAPPAPATSREAVEPPPTVAAAAEPARTMTEPLTPEGPGGMALGTPASPDEQLSAAAGASGEGLGGGVPSAPSGADGTAEKPAAGSAVSGAAGEARALVAGPLPGRTDDGSAGGGESEGAVDGTETPAPHELAAVRSRIDSRKVYPPIAIRNGWEGRVLVEMRLEGDGRLAAVRLLQGSGYAVLDEATLRAVRLASPFPPVARVVTVPVEYRLIP